ncbi:16S rRNA (guanine(527)-N(7))-methyltransferase RsmG [Saccharicrinis sp. FJH54]|uniref:16S rRNA (guanine(527)-N(7))-methyltransferase RsmG n=1 Tax=Saccharicrinis sp. FJH54 TaxID=3344665 RepID=UPI0035D4E6DC
MDLIKKYFPNLETEQFEKLEALIPLYRDWNTKINVVSRKDIDNLAVHHILHSLGIVKIIRFQPNTTVLDVGTGGGFPGIPLSIVFPRSNFHLVDSISKKIKVVQEIATTLELGNVRAEQKRVQQIKAKYDFVVSRAVTSFPRFVKMTQNNISDEHKNGLPNGIIYLKGGDFSKEIANFKDKVAVFKLTDYFTEEFFETKKVIYLPFA